MGRAPNRDLTKADITATTPRPEPYEVSDAKCRGLRLRVQPSGKKSWVVVYRVAERKTRRTLGDATHMTIGTARMMALEILSQTSRGIDVNAVECARQSVTLAGFLDNHFEAYAAEHIVSHVDFLARVRKHFADLLDRPMSEISELDMKRWKSRRQSEGVTFDTMKRELSYLVSVLNSAVRKFNVLPANPLANYQLEQTAANPIRRNPEKVRYLERGIEDVRLLAALAERDARIRRERETANKWRRARKLPEYPPIAADAYGDHLSPIVLLALLTGLDRGDLFSLTWTQVDLKLAQIRLKRGKVRRRSEKVWVLPLAPKAVEVLKQWQLQTGARSGLVFPSPVGERGRLTNIKKAWTEVRNAAQLENFRFKDLRHTFASWLVMGGIDLYTVAQLMCHSDVKTTQEYAHLSPDHKAAAVDRVFGGAA
jgi:integrase